MPLPTDAPPITPCDYDELYELTVPEQKPKETPIPDAYEQVEKFDREHTL